MLLQTLVVVCSAVFVAGTAVPPEMFEVTRERFGVAGVLPSLVTDGGAAAALIVALVRFRGPWEYRRIP